MLVTCHRCLLLIERRHLGLLQLNVAVSSSALSLGCLLLAASVGHAVQTDQRSHDKERANTGTHSAAPDQECITRGHRETEERKRDKRGRKTRVLCLDKSSENSGESLFLRGGHGGAL